MIEYFCKTPLPLLNTKLVPSGVPILVFEPTHYGYKQVLLWMSKNKGKACWRMVIPLTKEYIDVGDAIIDNRYDCLHLNTRTPIELVPISLNEETRTEKDWPFKTQHAELDFKMAMLALESFYLLPNALSGLSHVQEFMLKHIQLFDEHLIISMAVAQFDITSAKAREQFEHLKHGNLPYISKSPYLRLLPGLLLNGSFPISLEEICKAIIGYIDFGKIPDWSVIRSNYAAADGKSYSKKDDDGMIICPPYRVSRDTFHIQNNAFFLPTPSQPYRFSPNATYMTTNQIIWNGTCNQGLTFNTPFDYFKWWLNAIEPIIIDEYVAHTNMCRKDAELREFKRTIFVSANFQSNSGRLKRCFLDESHEEKKQRIMTKFSGHLDFLDTPISEISGESLCEIDKTEFESGRDYWKSIIASCNHNS